MGMLDSEPALGVNTSIWMEGSRSTLNVRKKLEPLVDPPTSPLSTKRDVSKPAFPEADSSINLVGNTPPDNYTGAQARYAELLGEDMFALMPNPLSRSKDKDKAKLEPQWQPSQLSQSQPFVVPENFSGLSEVRPMAWGKPHTSTGQLLRQAEMARGPPGAHVPAKSASDAATWGPFDPAPMHPPDPSSMIPFPERMGLKPVIGYEKQSTWQKEGQSRWQEGPYHHQEELKAVKEIMHILWSDQPVNTLVKNLESLGSIQRHAVLEVLVGLMRNTGVIAKSLSNMTSSLDIYLTGQAVIDAAILLVGSNMCALHVCADHPQGEDLLWRLQHEGGSTISTTSPKTDRIITRAPTTNAGLVGACLDMQEPMVIWDAHHDARYVSAIDSLGNSVGEGAAIACVPLVDQRWQSHGQHPHVLGILQLVVGHGPDKGRKKRLGLEMRSLLAVVGAHAGQCLTNSVMHTLQTELAERLDANQAIMRLLSRDMSDEHMAATIATEAGLTYGATRCSFFLVKDLPGAAPSMTRVEVSMEDGGENVHVMEGIPIGEGLPGEAYSRAHTLNVADAESQSTYLSSVDKPTGQDANAEQRFHILTVPVIANLGRKDKPECSALAIIQVLRTSDRHPFSNVEVQAVEELALLLAPLLDSLHLDRLGQVVTQTARRAQDRMARLFAESWKTPVVLDLEWEIAETMVLSSEIARARSAAVFLVDCSTNELVSNLVSDNQQVINRETPLRVPLDTGILGEVARTGEVVKATNPTFAPGYHADVDGQLLGIQEQLLLAIPVFKSAATPERVSCVAKEATIGQRLLAPSAGAVSTPLTHANVVAVVCVLDRKDGSEFSDNEVSLLEELGRVVTSSLEALVIYENTIYKTAVEQSRSSMLLQATCAMLSATRKGIPDIIDVASSFGADIFDCMECDMYLYDDKLDLLWRDPTDQGPHDYRYVRPGEGIVGEVLQTGQTLRDMTVMEDGFAESTLTAPLIDESAELVGVCQLRNKRGVRAGELVGQFKEEDELLVPGFTVQVATVLANALAMSRMQQKAELNEELQKVISPVIQRMEMADLCEAVAEYAKPLIAAEAVYYFFVDGIALLSVGQDSEIHLPLSSLAGQAVQRNMIVNVHHTDTDERYDETANKALPPFANCLCVPVYSEKDDRVIGVIQFCNKVVKPNPMRCTMPVECSTFMPMDETVAKALADILAVHSRNAASVQASAFTTDYANEIMHTHNSIVLVLNQEGYVTSSSAPLESFANNLREEEIRSMKFHEWLDHGPNAALCADIKQVYQTNLPVTAGDVKLQTKRGYVRVSYSINPLTSPSSGSIFTVGQPPAEQSPRALFPGVSATHRGGVMVFLHHLSPENRTKQAFERVLPSVLAEQALAQGVHDTPRTNHMVSLQVGIRNFVELFPGKFKVAHVKLFNRFLSCTVPLVMQRGGLIVNYTTTGFIAGFGLFAENDGGMERSAMRAAVDVVDCIKALNRERCTENEAEDGDDAQPVEAIVVGVVVASDDLVVAKVGCEQHMTLGIMGNGVQQCKHISEFSKRYFPRTSSILLTQAVYEIVKENYIFRELDVLLFPEDSAEHSIASGIGVYHFLGNEELDLHPNMLESLVVYKDALALYKEGHWGKAMPYFRKANLQSIHSLLPDGDSAALEMLERCRELLETPPLKWHRGYVLDGSDRMHLRPSSPVKPVTASTKPAELQ